MNAQLKPCEGHPMESDVELDHVNIQCANLDGVKDFYGQLLALTVGPRPPFSSEGYWLYSAGAPLVHLVQKPRDTSEAAVKSSLDHVAFRCRNVQSARIRLQEMGVTFRETAIPNTNIIQFFLHDPEGVGIEMNFPQ